MTPDEARSLTTAIGAWVRSRPELRALALAGSWARGVARPDSDLDLLILTHETEQYRSGLHWFYQIILPAPFRVVCGKWVQYGAVWSCHAALDPVGELELSFAALDWTATDPVDAGSRRVIQEGFTVIVDKDG